MLKLIMSVVLYYSVLSQAVLYRELWQINKSGSVLCFRPRRNPWSPSYTSPHEALQHAITTATIEYDGTQHFSYLRTTII